MIHTDKTNAALREWGYSGDTATMELNYYKDRGATSNNRTDAENEFLNLHGLTGSTEDKWVALVKKLGYGNTIPDAINNSNGLFNAGDIFPVRSLFKNSEVGVWYDPSDLSTMFQDSAGTTPVTAVEQPVGLLLDKSRGLVLGPELVTNGDFSNGTTGWTGYTSGSIAVTAGVATVTNGSALSGRATSPITTVIGRSYVLSSGIVTGNNGQSAAIGVSNNPDGTAAFATRTNAGSLVFTATATTTYVALYVNTLVAGNSATFDNISVRELPGNHATQSTTTSRPVLSSRYNLLTRTEEFDHSDWNKSFVSVTPNAISAPDGALTADLIARNASGDARVNRSVSGAVVGASYTASVYLKQNTARYAVIQIVNGASGAYFYADLQNGTISQAVAGYGASPPTSLAASVVSVGGDWFRCLLTFVSTSTSIETWFKPITSGTGSGSNTSDTIGASFYIWGAQLIVTNDLPSNAYQRVVTSTDYDADFSKFKPYLRFDGTDDWLQTGNIDFTSTDKMTVVAGVRKLSDAAAGVVLELGNAVTTQTFGIMAPVSAGFGNYNWRTNGNAGSIVQVNNNTFSAPISNVVSGVASIAEDIAILRVNGTQVNSNAADQGTGAYGNYPLYIGRRGGTSFTFNGRLYGLIVRGAASSAAQIAAVERFMGVKTGVTL